MGAGCDLEAPLPGVYTPEQNHTGGRCGQAKPAEPCSPCWSPRKADLGEDTNEAWQLNAARGPKSGGAVLRRALLGQLEKPERGLHGSKSIDALPEVSL